MWSVRPPGFGFREGLAGPGGARGLATCRLGRAWSEGRRRAPILKNHTPNAAKCQVPWLWAAKCSGRLLTVGDSPDVQWAFAPLLRYPPPASYQPRGTGALGPKRRKAQPSGASWVATGKPERKKGCGQGGSLLHPRKDHGSRDGWKASGKRPQTHDLLFWAGESLEYVVVQPSEHQIYSGWDPRSIAGLFTIPNPKQEIP